MVSVGVGPIMIVKGNAGEEFPFESVTVALPLMVPVSVGVPEMVTVLPEDAKVSVPGNPVMVHVKGATPPVTFSVPV